MATPPTPPAAMVFDHYGLSVADLGRSLRFYVDVLGGVVILAPHEVDEFGFRRAVISIGGMGIDLNQHDRDSSEAFSPVRTGLDHLAFGVSCYEDLVAWAAHLEGEGIACSPIRELDGVGEAFDVRDPDGIQIEWWRHDQNGGWADFVRQKLDEHHAGGESPLKP